ncbi:MAG TPA: endonuclease/exonuclease/phosphatase family protein [Blastocatellia bacterium]|nr:endonuclease/exonuclease/phosphatase family protein [Blastocatellia bacterium]
MFTALALATVLLFYTLPASAYVSDGGAAVSLPALAVYSAPEVLSYDEVLSLAQPEEVNGDLHAKLDALLSTPFVSNEAYMSGIVPELSESEKLGRIIRVGFWNVQRGVKVEEIKMALERPEEFERRIKAEAGSAKHREAVEQLEVLRSVDVLVLNEADLGLERSGYADVSREIAAALKMNYTFGVEFVEVDPVNLGIEQFKDQPVVDRNRYRGLHGSAILSRFPIKQARLVPLKHQPYDWYNEEKKRVSIAESARRRLGEIAFQADYARQIRRGGRSVLIAELHIPQLPEGQLTVVTTHLENRCKPSGRRRQMQEVLSLIKGIEGPLVLAGDLNTSGSSLKPISLAGEIRKRVTSKRFWAGRALKTLIPLGFAADFALDAINYASTASDPTARGIPLLSPNKEKELFKDIRRARFDDGYTFDFRGDAERTINGTEGTLANSNQRARTKGFISTHAMDRTYKAVGKNKLDWIFVKAYTRDPQADGQPYRLAPHFPRTLERLNYSLGYRLSDHNPITVDLPVDEPAIVIQKP